MGGVPQRLEYVLYRMAERLALGLPESCLPRAADLLSVVAFHGLQVRRAVCLSNLAVAFPGMPLRQRQALARAAYRHFCRLVLEFFKLQRWEPEQLKRRLHVATPEPFRRFLQEFSGGVVLVSGHLGNWEPALAYLAHFVRPTTAVMQRIKNPGVDARMAAVRRRWGTELVYSRGALRAGSRALKQGRLLAVLADQDAGTRGLFVSFLGRPASTPPGPAWLALKYRAPLLFAASIRQPNGLYRLELVPLATDYPDRPFRGALEALTYRYAMVLEQYVHRYPEQYFWLHRRWKTRLPTASSLATGGAGFGGARASFR